MLSWVAITGAAVVAFVALAYWRGWTWAGFAAEHRPQHPELERPSKTLWDWLQLLVVPLVLSVLAIAFNASQSERDQRREDRRAERELAIAADRRRDDALDAYVRQMSELMLDRKLASSPSEDVQGLARTLTLTVLNRLDTERKATVVEFLNDAQLIQRPSPSVDLSGADLRQVRLDGPSSAQHSARLTCAAQISPASSL